MNFQILNFQIIFRNNSDWSSWFKHFNKGSQIADPSNKFVFGYRFDAIFVQFISLDCLYTIFLYLKRSSLVNRTKKKFGFQMFSYIATERLVKAPKSECSALYCKVNVLTSKKRENTEIQTFSYPISRHKVAWQKVQNPNWFC